MLRPSFTIFDNKAHHHNDPMFFNYDAEAKREFQILAKNEKSRIHQFPADFDLYHVGYHDTDSGRQTSIDIPKLVLTGLQAIQTEVTDVTRM